MEHQIWPNASMLSVSSIFRLRSIMLLWHRAYRHLHGSGQLSAHRDALRHHMAHRGHERLFEMGVHRVAADAGHGELPLRPGQGMGHREPHRLQRLHLPGRLDPRVPHHQHTGAQIQEGIESPQAWKLFILEKFSVTKVTCKYGVFSMSTIYFLSPYKKIAHAYGWHASSPDWHYFHTVIILFTSGVSYILTGVSFLNFRLRVKL